MKSVISELNSHLYKRVWMNLEGFYKSFTILLCGVSYNIHSGSLKIITVPLVSNLNFDQSWSLNILPHRMKHNLFSKNLKTWTSSSSSRNIYFFNYLNWLACETDKPPVQAIPKLRGELRRVSNFWMYPLCNPLTPKSDLIDFILSNARRFYSSKGDPLAVKGLINQSINGHHHMKDHVKIDHLTKYDAFRVNRDQVMDLGTWYKIHTNNQSINKLYLNVERPPSQGEISLTNMGTF